MTEEKAFFIDKGFYNDVPAGKKANKAAKKQGTNYASRLKSTLKWAREEASTAQWIAAYSKDSLADQIMRHRKNLKSEMLEVEYSGMGTSDVMYHGAKLVITLLAILEESGYEYPTSTPPMRFRVGSVTVDRVKGAIEDVLPAFVESYKEEGCFSQDVLDAILEFVLYFIVEMKLFTYDIRRKYKVIRDYSIRKSEERKAEEAKKAQEVEEVEQKESRVARVMKRAWELARSLVAGLKDVSIRSTFALCLKQAWKEITA